MPYTPDPLDVTNPLDTVDISTAAAEFRALKVYLQTIIAGIPQVSKSADYTMVLGDGGKHIFHPATDNNPRTFTIPANAAVAYPIGTTLTFINRINTVTIAINADTLRFAVFGTTGSRTLAVDGMATAVKINTTEWMISGAGLS